MISNQENIAAVFSIFHDGVITSHLSSKEGLLLIVEIKYLAERIEPSYTKFLVCLFGAKDIEFHTWPNDANNSSVTLSTPAEIFKPSLEIVEGGVRGQAIEVVCNQTSPEFPYGGGELQFQVELATVSDEAGRFWSIEQLEELCKGYWDACSNAAD